MKLNSTTFHSVVDTALPGKKRSWAQIVLGTVDNLPATVKPTDLSGFYKNDMVHTELRFEQLTLDHAFVLSGLVLMQLSGDKAPVYYLELSNPHSAGREIYVKLDSPNIPILFDEMIVLKP